MTRPYRFISAILAMLVLSALAPPMALAGYSDALLPTLDEAMEISDAEMDIVKGEVVTYLVVRCALSTPCRSAAVQGAKYVASAVAGGVIYDAAKSLAKKIFGSD